jgi:hypothetical protein
MKSHFTVDKKYISLNVLEMIEHSLKYRQMYSIEEITGVFFPEPDELSQYGIPQNDKHIKKYLLPKQKSKADIIRESFEKCLFKQPGQSSPELAPFTQIFKLTPKDIIDSSEILLRKVSMAARIYFGVRDLFKAVMGGKGSEAAAVKKPVKKAKSSKRARQEVKPPESPMVQQIRTLYNQNGRETKFINNLFQNFFIEPDEKVLKIPYVKKMLTDGVLIYNKPANYYYLSVLTVQAIKEGEEAARYLNERTRKLDLNIYTVETNMQNKHVIIPQEEKAALPYRKELLDRYKHGLD